jgi:hypothetical protein
VLVKNNLIDPRLIDNQFSTIVISLWERYEPIIIEYRRLFEAPPRGMLHQDFEDLYYAMLEEQPKLRKDFLERLLPLRAEKRKVLGLKPIPPYP